MKSIKEKAKEYERSQCTQDYCWLDVEEAFEAGANYVLDKIEKLVKFNRWAAQDLYELIEQLKK